MNRRFKRPTCLVVSALVVLALLVLVPCGLVASVKLSGKNLRVLTPYVALYVSDPSSKPAKLGMMHLSTTTIDFGGCSSSTPSNSQISIGTTTISLFRCYNLSRERQEYLEQHYLP